MSLPEDLIVNNECEKTLALDLELNGLVHLEIKNEETDKNLQNFTHEIGIKTMFVKSDCSESESVTINEDIRSESVISMPYESGNIENVYEDQSAHVSVNIGTESIPLIAAHTSVIESPLIDDALSKLTEENYKINHNENVLPMVPKEFSMPKCDEKIIPACTSVIIENNCDISMSNEKTPEMILFTDELDKLSATIQQKDEEIKKLSQKLVEMGNKIKTPKSDTKRPSVKSPLMSSNESMCPKDMFEEKHKVEKNLSEKRRSDEPILKNDFVDISKNDINFSNVSNVIGTELISPSRDFPTAKQQEEIIPGLRQKLSDLEEEVKRLQKANVDSVLTLQCIQNSIPAFEKPMNETIINRLLVDHSLLKEELDQLKWEHSKLTQPNVLGEEIKQLKAEVSVLRNQNELLQQYIKSTSTKSLNNSPDVGAWKDSVEDFGDHLQEFPLSKPRSFVDNHMSDYIYERLDSKHRVTSGIPNVSSMLQHNIESLESPYRATCQSIQHCVPFNGGGSETYRARKVSDSSSNLIEDMTPKVWLEPVSTNYRPMYYRPTKPYELPQERPEFDQYSVDSFVTVTTSVTENERDDWKYAIKNSTEAFVSRKDESDLLSIADSDTIPDSTNRDDYKRKPTYSYSFTPKAPVDLTLDDLVKFARPGGKMSTGRVCFVGHLPGRREVCVGLELDEDAGKHDGVFESVRYFQCRKNRGVFISFHKIILAYKSN